MTPRTTLNIISYISVFLVFIVVSLLLYWQFYPYRIIEFTNVPYKVMNPIVNRGGYIRYVVDYCKYSKINPIISKYFVDGIIYTVPPTVGIEKELGCGQTNPLIYIPKALPPGNYYVKIVYRYQLNPLRYEDISVNTEKFTVVEATPSANN